MINGGGVHGRGGICRMTIGGCGGGRGAQRSLHVDQYKHKREKISANSNRMMIGGGTGGRGLEVEQSRS